jgi:hypothetical protein
MKLFIGIRHKQLSSNREFCEKRRNESQALFTVVDEFLFVISIIITRSGQIIV